MCSEKQRDDRQEEKRKLQFAISQLLRALPAVMSARIKGIDFKPKHRFFEFFAHREWKFVAVAFF
jgi:hypothetical protein